MYNIIVYCSLMLAILVSLTSLSLPPSLPPSPSPFNQRSHSGDLLDRELIHRTLLAKQGPCLLDCMELVLADVDVFSARKAPLFEGVSIQDGYHYKIERDVRIEWVCVCDRDLCLVGGEGSEGERNFKVVN